MSLGEGSNCFFKKEFASIKDHFCHIPFGIDIDFWKRRKRELRQKKKSFVSPFILFVGNDKWRDFEMVVKIAESLNGMHFKWLTHKISPEQCPKNAQVINSLTDIEVKSLYQESLFVILPVRDTLQPSGQSCTLQVMSCGLPVMISKTKGFCSPNDFEHKKHIIFVEHRLVDWVKAIKELIEDSQLRNCLSKEGSNLVREKYSTHHFAESLAKLLEE